MDRLPKYVVVKMEQPLEIKDTNSNDDQNYIEISDDEEIQEETEETENKVQMEIYFDEISKKKTFKMEILSEPEIIEISDTEESEDSEDSETSENSEGSEDENQLKEESKQTELLTEMTPPSPPRNDELKCKICDKSFSRKSHVIRHTLIHSRTVECNRCNRKFISRNLMEAHRKTHSITPSKNSVQKRIRKPSSNQPNKRRLSCPLCQLKLKTRSTLRNHIKEVHSDARPFKCPMCSYTSKRKQQCEAHFYRHHTKNVVTNLN